MKNVKELANAIILQAVSDWRHSVRHPNTPEAKLERAETEAFFLSGWFGMLTDIDGRWLLNKLREEAGLNDRGRVSGAGE